MFILFSGEEQGTLGSLAYAADCYHADDRIAGIINLDGIGHTETGQGGKKVIVYEEPSVAWLADAMEHIAGNYHQEVDMELKRLDENNKFLEASFLVEFNNFNDLNKVRTALHELDDSIQINFLDHKGIV